MFEFFTWFSGALMCVSYSIAVILLLKYRVGSMTLLCLCARLFICALWSPAGKGLSFVVSNCECVTCPLVSWVRCGT